MLYSFFLYLSRRLFPNLANVTFRKNGIFKKSRVNGGTAFLCGFGGISVLFQTKTVLDGLPVLRCVLAKLAHGISSFVLCRVVLMFADLRIFSFSALPPLPLLAALTLVIPALCLLLPVFFQNLWKTRRRSCIIDRNSPRAPRTAAEKRRIGNVPSVPKKRNF